MLARNKLYLAMLTILLTGVAFGQEAPPKKKNEQPARTLQVTVKEKASGKPIAQAKVHASFESGDEQDRLTGSAGVAKFGNVPDGRVKVRATCDGCSPGGNEIPSDKDSTEITLEKKAANHESPESTGSSH